MSCRFHLKEQEKKVIWELTNQCNYSCSYCIFASSGYLPEGELSLTKIKSTLIELKEQGFSHIKFTGGEPFLRKDIFDILQSCENLDLSYDISTNSSLINQENIQQFDSLNPSFVHISVDGHHSFSHEIVRGKNTFDKTIHGLKLLLNKNIKVRVGVVLHAHNQDDIFAMTSWFYQLGVRHIAFSIMTAAGKMQSDSPLLINRNLSEISKEFNDLKHHYHDLIIQDNFTTIIQFNPKSMPCPAGERFLFIDSLGYVSPCSWISDVLPQYHVENLNQKSLEEILGSLLFQQFSELKINFESKKINCMIDEINLSEKAKTFNKWSLYSFSTENIQYINDIQKIINQPVRKTFSVLGAGDQVISLLLHDCFDFDLVDINPISIHYFYLKVKAIETLSFIEFKQFFLIGEKSFDYHLYKKIKRNCVKDENFHLLDYWDKKYKKNMSGIQIRNGLDFNLLFDFNELKVRNVPYLQASHTYESIQSKISQLKFNFQHINLFSKNSNLKLNHYQLILLSNLSDYAHYAFSMNTIEEYKKNLIDRLFSHLDTHGFMMISYCYDRENSDHNVFYQINLEQHFKHLLSIEIPCALQEGQHLKDVVFFLEKV